ncbi:hypothetical protein P8452_50555 [Trifolium repens]|jgi:hypothetical protein|nr:hypothetical protein P8452_50555 [Trifolium repens]
MGNSPSFMEQLWDHSWDIDSFLHYIPAQNIEKQRGKVTSKFLQQIMLTILIEGQYIQNPKTELSSMKNDAHSKKCEIVPNKPFTGRSSMQSKNGKVQ